MHRLRKNNHGFAHIGLILLALVVIVTICGVGYYVATKKDKTNTNPTISTSQSSTQNTANSSENKYLVIKEWGIKVQQPTALTAISYKIENNILVFSSDQQKQLGCDEVRDSWGIVREHAGSLIDADGTKISDQEADEMPSYIHIANYYYSRAYPQTGCEKESDKMSMIDDAYTSLFKTLTSSE
ncbi:hypothetical protein A3D14_03715 [Candidatus Saccharibacteria bacterium RIFCSPHIGHO2_02_FULL_47_12]|nr:MAG: hypothetical protein A3D14_03715 [Candidatus Saccharibacteria bacterium RIFCSPHIGHO2_02_FULL_47_12]